MVNERVVQLNEMLAAAGDLLGNVKVAIVRVDELDLLEENARFMSNEMFTNLVKNIEKDGALTSVPYCWQQPNKRYLVLSGNHRTKAARAAGREWIMIFYNDGPMSEQERIAKQLSHNAISGQDDPVILKRLYSRLEQVDLKYYAGLDDKTLQELERITLPPLSEIRLDFRTCTFLFLPEEQAQIEAAFRRAIQQTTAKDLYLARFEDFDRTMDALAKTQDAYNVRNAATAMTIILDLFTANQTELASGWDWRNDEQAKQASWVPLASIFGTDRVPIGVANQMKRLAQLMMDRGEVEKKNLWQALEFAVADCLSRQ